MGARLHFLIVIYHVLNYSLSAGTEAREDNNNVFQFIPSQERTEGNVESTCHHSDVTHYLKQLVNTFPNISRLRSIGNSTEGRELWTVVISDNPYERTLLKPAVKFVGNINGYSGSSCVVLIKLIKFLLEHYYKDDELRRLVNGTEIHILPNMNPDGYANSVPGECVSNQGRLNAKGAYLNRNFYASGEGPAQEKETVAIINWMKENSFIVSASFISGAKVISYPFDSTPAYYPTDLAHETLGPDDKTFQFLASKYVNFVNQESQSPFNWYCPSLNKIFPEGFINGAEWQSVSGTMMDYNYVQGTFEILIALDCCKNDNNTHNLGQIWQNNKYAMLSMIEEAEFSFRGQVIDAVTGLPLNKVQIMTLLSDDHPLSDHSGIRMPFFTNRRGEFWRVLVPGKYVILVTLNGYETQIVPVEINETRPPELLVKMKTKYIRRRGTQHKHNLNHNKIFQDKHSTETTRNQPTTEEIAEMSRDQQQYDLILPENKLSEEHENRNQIFSKSKELHNYNVHNQGVTNFSTVQDTAAFHELEPPHPKALIETLTGKSCTQSQASIFLTCLLAFSILLR